MMTQTDLTREVQEVIESLVANNEPAGMTLIVQEVVKRHDAPIGDDADFFLLCAYSHVHWTVRDVLRQRHADESQPDTDRQLVFRGYKRVQLSYTILRGGKQMVVPLQQMTRQEGRAKSAELRRMAVGCVAHAQELDDYFDARDSGHAQGSAPSA